MQHHRLVLMDRKSFWIVFICLALLLFFKLTSEASVSTEARGDSDQSPIAATTPDWTPNTLRSMQTPEKINVFAFGSCASPQFRRFRNDIDLLARQREDMAIHIIDLGYRWNAGRRCVGPTRVDSIPHVLILDRDGTILAADNGTNKDGLELLGQWMREIRTQARANGSDASL